MAAGRPIGDLHVSAAVVIPAAELQWRFSRSAGPGGQNVNKVETAVELGFDLEGTSAIGPFQKQRLLERLGSRCVAGCLRVAVSEHRSQYQNRQLALQRLADLLREGLRPPPKLRKPTKPTRGAMKRRVEAKKQRSAIKGQRQARFTQGDD
jgi:ribosome-associated protein